MISLLVFCTSVAFSSPDIVAAADAPGYTQTRYPIVLVPGAILFNMPFDAWSYWWGIVAALQQGGADVHVSSVPVGTDDVRGEVLLRQIDHVLALSGAAKVNLIGYSQGGQTARYAAAMTPEKVASVTTVASPTRGSLVAAFLTGDVRPEVPASLKGHILRALTMLSRYLSVLPHQDKDFMAAIAALTPEGAAHFNAQFPAGVPREACGEGDAEAMGVQFFSWGGVGNLTNFLDPSDPTFLLTSSLFGGPNDGMVGRCDSHFGRVIRDDFAQNHFDAINQMFGLASWRGANPKAIYRAHANRLRNLGL